MAWSNKTETFEAKVVHKAPKSYLVEMTLGGRYFVPFKCITSMSDDADEDGNRVFEVTEWWWNKKDDFEVTDE